jgi:hypothetical protein
LEKPGVPSDAIDTRTDRAWIDEENIIRVEVHPGEAVALEDAEEHIEVGRALAAGREYTLLLLDISGIHSITREARVHYSRQDQTPGRVLNRAIAILVSSPLTRVIANFFVGLNRPRTPVRLFTSEEQAVDWLRTFGR